MKKKITPGCKESRKKKQWPKLDESNPLFRAVTPWLATGGVFNSAKQLNACYIHTVHSSSDTENKKSPLSMCAQNRQRGDVPVRRYVGVLFHLCQHVPHDFPCWSGRFGDASSKRERNTFYSRCPKSWAHVSMMWWNLETSGKIYWA